MKVSAYIISIYVCMYTDIAVHIHTKNRFPPSEPRAVWNLVPLHVSQFSSSRGFPNYKPIFLLGNDQKFLCVKEINFPKRSADTLCMIGTHKSLVYSDIRDRDVLSTSYERFAIEF